MNEAVPTGSTIHAAAALPLLQPLTELVARAGAAILAVERDSMAVDSKTDGTPVTEADIAAHHIIVDGLRSLLPDVPVLSEESAHLATPPYRHSFFLVDPLDGTKEFIAGRDEFTVNVALVTHGQPVLGVIGAPALGLIWRGLAGHGAERIAIGPDASIGAAEPIRTRAFPPTGTPWVAAVSRSHGDPRSEAFLAKRPGGIRRELGSSVKFARLAEGSVDIYPRLAPTCEWDVAAGCALVMAAGGKITDAQGKPLHFGELRNDFRVPDFIAWGDPSAA
ncbi:MAG TPA: 3'(2'),5'-bisphosphate nucleotidase CysQ [Nitrobacter sp.]|jgi:3'(2'), 5'-bisphosphate nucleotidase|nr:3'(2'),5'-bisphosphate nucleotidase CysQ [Nitrobacter sp.]